MQCKVGALLCVVSDEVARMRQEPDVHFSTEYFVTVRTETSRLFWIAALIGTGYRDKYGLIFVFSFEKLEAL
jgi:hypothetical protein